MTEPAYPTSPHDYASDGEELERLERAMDGDSEGSGRRFVDRGGLLLIGWLGMYFLVFLPRGTVG